jgi:hypothetical protein
MLCSACRIKCGLSVTLPRFTFDGKQAAPAVYDSASDCTLAVIGLGRAEDDAKNAEIARLRAELARYTSDLTDDEYAALSCSKGLDQYPSDLPRIFDAALRRVRGGE